MSDIAVIDHRQPESGIAATDWEVSQLRPLLKRSPRYGINAAAVPEQASLPTYIRITDISEDGKFDSSPRVSVDHPASADYFLNPGDIVVARTGASVGKSYLYNTEDGRLVYAGFLICLSADEKKLDPRYLAYCLQTRRYWDWVTRTSVRSGQPGINGGEFGSFTINVPTVPEQGRISETLGDADSQITLLKRLIAKKTAIKQGTMQQLLTGRTRLPGFSGSWRTARLGELGMFLKGRGIKRDDVRSFGTACIRYGELYTTFKNYTNSVVSYVDPTVATTALPIRNGDILFAGSGETREEIGVCVAYAGKAPAVAGGDIIVLRGNEFNPIYVASLSNMPHIVAQKSRLGQGDAVVHISSTALSTVELDLPPIEEQNVIADIILESDREIEVLQLRLVKAKALKEGLMQELLTGRTRLQWRPRYEVHS